MRIVIVSDTHGWRQNLHCLYSKAKEIGAKIFIHLGDDYDDMNYIDDGEIEIIKVPGTRNPQYHEKDISNRVIQTFEGWRFLLSHTKASTHDDMRDDINPVKAMASGEADVLLHGHTHKPEIVKEKGFIRINPGHLNNNDGREPRLTYCVIEVTEKHLKALILSFDDDTILQSAKYEKLESGK